MFEKIMYPTNLEEFSLPILKSLSCLKAGGLREVVLSHIIDTDALYAMRRSGLPVDEEQIKNSVQKELDSYSEYLEAENIKSKIRIVTGSVVSEIVKTSTEEEVSLIVAGRQKRDVLGELFVGSTTDRVIRKSKLPVLVTKYHTLKEIEGKVSEQFCSNMFRKILYPTDWSLCAERAKQYISILHKVGASEIVIAHVKEDRFESEVYCEQELESLNKEFQAEGFKVSTRMLQGKAYKEINRVATQEDVSLIVMGSHGKGFVEGILWGSVSQRVVEYSEKPVLVVK
ncbi:MAG: universal stress protein [Nitrospira sp.]|nr:universal stress protein [Nitrospira sp.]